MKKYLIYAVIYSGCLFVTDVTLTKALAASNNVTAKGAGTQTVVSTYPQSGIKGRLIDIYSYHEIYIRNDSNKVQGYSYSVQLCSETNCKTEPVNLNVAPNEIYRRQLKFKHTVSHKNGGSKTLYARTWIEGHVSNYVQETSVLNIPY